MNKTLKTILPEKLNMDIFRQLSERWMLLTAGNFETGHYNGMTISWGMFGTIWNKPTVMVMARPQRYTLEFLNEYDTFTLSAFPGEYHSALAYCGSHCGRDEANKLAAAGLTPVASNKVEAPSFAEAELILECRRLYKDSFLAKNFFDKNISMQFFPDRDYHEIFIAEVLHIAGTDDYIRKGEEE